jgi:ABC-type dipeptide/oligopeptide/nickel transport system permease subunit
MGAVEAPRPSPLADGSFVRARGGWAQALRRVAREPTTLAALVVLVGILAAGALAPVIAPRGWTQIDLAARWQNHAPTLAGGHLLGTDNIGRDVLVRTLYGIHTSEQAALLAALVATLLGLAVGCLAGYAGGWLDALLMRLADLVTAFPALMLLYAAYIFLEPVTIRKATIIFSLYLWTYVARVVRAALVSLRNVEFVEAARALGASWSRVLRRHVLPNAAGVVLVAASALVGQVMMLEATVEFFGLGVPSQIQPSLGNLIGDAAGSGIGPYNDLGLGWWVWAAPAIVLVAIIVCVNLVGDGLDVALNPTVSRR